LNLLHASEERDALQADGATVIWPSEMRNGAIYGKEVINHTLWPRMLCFCWGARNWHLPWIRRPGAFILAIRGPIT